MSERISRDGAQERTPRNLQTREREARTEYVPPSTLPNPEPRPGLRHRWIATELLGEAINQNVSKKMREGWEPVRAEDYPELLLEGNKNGNVEIQGLMLCSMPEEKAESRNRYYNRHAQAQVESVDNSFMRNNDPRMPLFSEKNSKTTRGTGFGSGSK
jgi:hypothetical protein